MCTALTYKSKDHYFGRNLDLEYSYHETITITPRNFPFSFRKAETLLTHYALIGMAYVAQEYPLYYEATNEKGLSMAGLNFPGNAYYPDFREGKDNVAPFEFIPWILGQCATVAEAGDLLSRINLVNLPFSRELPLSPLHWMISDREQSIVVESMGDGLHIYDNPAEVLTNNPPFNHQLFQLNNYRHLSPCDPENHFNKDLKFDTYCRGLGALGLPGDWSSQSRFVRAAFVRANALPADTEEESVSQFFHLLSAVEMPKGCVLTATGKPDITIYSSCCNTDKGIYYYTTYDNRQITAVDMHKTDLDSRELTAYPMLQKQSIFCQN